MKLHTLLALCLLRVAVAAPWSKTKPPAEPEREPVSVLLPTVLCILVCWLLPLVLMKLSVQWEQRAAEAETQAVIAACLKMAEEATITAATRPKPKAAPPPAPKLSSERVKLAANLHLQFSKSTGCAIDVASLDKLAVVKEGPYETKLLTDLQSMDANGDGKSLPQRARTTAPRASKLAPRGSVKHPGPLVFRSPALGPTACAVTFDEMSEFLAATGAALSDDEYALLVNEMVDACETALKRGTPTPTAAPAAPPPRKPSLVQQGSVIFEA